MNRHSLLGMAAAIALSGQALSLREFDESSHTPKSTFNKIHRSENRRRTKHAMSKKKFKGSKAAKKASRGK